MMTTTILRGAVLGLMAAAGLVGCEAGGGQALTPTAARNLLDVPFPPTPDADAFYAQPAAFEGTVPGQILASRRIVFAPAGVALSNEAWHLKFVSSDHNGQPLAAVATVVKPVTPAPAGARLLSYQFPINALGLHCAASHAMAGSTANSTIRSELANPMQALSRGWTLLTPDYLGPYSAYGAWPLAGRITLDAVRAALKFDPLGLTAETPVGLWGYSGGAGATAWAAALHQAYAPELTIAAIATGGTPADGLGIVRKVDEDPVANAAFFSLVMSAIVGTNRAYPFLLDGILNEKGKAMARSLRDGCGGSTSDGSPRPTGHLADYTTVEDPYHAPGAQRLRRLTTLPLQGHRPIADTFVYHSIVDQLIPVQGADAMVAGWCAEGAPVSYYRSYHGEHVGFQPTASPAVMAYLTSRLEGAAARVVPPGTVRCN